MLTYQQASPSVIPVLGTGVIRRRRSKL